MFAVIKTGGKQYLVQKGDKLKVEKLEKKEGDKIILKEVLLVSNETGKEIKVGEPFIKKAQVSATLIKQGRYDKVTIIKQKPKKRYKLKQGHKQPFSEIEITEIVS